MKPSPTIPANRGRDVDRTAPFKLRARRRGGERHANSGREGDPDQGELDQSPTVRLQRDQTGSRTKCASRLVSLTLGITGRRNTVLRFTAVIGEMTMRLAEHGNDLRHLETELPFASVRVAPYFLRVVLLPFGGVRPDLDALPRERCPVAGSANGARHPKTTPADPIDDGRALAVVVGAAGHRIGRCEAFGAGGQQQPGNPGRQDTAPPAASRLRRLSARVVM